MSADEKWQLAQRAWRMVQDAARRRIQRQNPRASISEVDKELARFIARART
jgi:hypothetical protein